ncbi:MAG: molybdopterin-dependent oxidoreductase [Burkholderiales bacterium]
MKLDPAGFVRDLRLAPHELVDRVTPQRDLFVLAHVGVPQIDVATWRLEIGGLIERPRTFSFDEIRQLPKRNVESFHQCAGFPRRPDIATRRVANVVWSGADLGDVLREAVIKPEARFLVSHGLDNGEYDGLAAADYVKDMPIERLTEGGLLLAYEINGEPLTRAHGFPLRLVIPGYYGTNAVKWLRRLELTAERAGGIFTQELYNDPVAPGSSPDGASTRPVWEAGPEAIIVAPRHGSSLGLTATEIFGWAWAASGVARVEISADGGLTWQQASLEPRAQWSWQRFSVQWLPPASGAYTLMARATDARGVTQPMERARNSVHTVRVDVARS